MNPTQQSELMKALKEGNDVRVVTMALHIAASLARDKRQDEAIAIRTLIDDHHNREADEKAYKKLRLEVATQLLATRKDSAAAVKDADELIHACAVTPLPKY